MKKLSIISFFIFIFTTGCYSQYYCGIDENSELNSVNIDSSDVFIDVYGFEVNGFNTSSGLNGGYEMAIFAKSNNKSLEFGTYIDRRIFLLSGLSIVNKFYFKNNSALFQNFKSYAFYSFIYRVTRLDSMSVTNQEMPVFLQGKKARYASMEHYIGLGMEWKVYRQIYINSNLGFGRYIGSIEKAIPVEKNSIFNKGSNGWSGYFKVGLGYRL